MHGALTAAGKNIGPDFSNKGATLAAVSVKTADLVAITTGVAVCQVNL
jgi:hypothetical protein